MSDSIYRLVYLSQNHIGRGQEALHREIENILVVARRNNVVADVTGALMFNNGRFAQVLEGSHRSIQETFERIQCDLRHHNVTVLMFEKTDERRFSNWSMGYVGDNTQASNTFAHVTSESGFNPAGLTGEYVYDLLREHLLEAERA